MVEEEGNVAPTTVENITATVENVAATGMGHGTNSNS